MLKPSIDIDKVHARLEAEKKRLTAELDEIQEAGRPSEERREGSPFGKREEEATESQELERRIASERQIKEQLADIEVALGKIKAGTYGFCEVCGRPIEPARLEILLSARLCLKDKALQLKNAKK